MSSIDPEVVLPDRRSSRGSERARALRFSLVLGTVLALIAFAAHRRHHDAVATTLGGVAAVLLGLALVSPRAALGVERAWMGFAAVLGRINGTLILGILYFFFLTPLARISRLVRENPLSAAKKSSYFHPRTETRDKSRFESPY